MGVPRPEVKLNQVGCFYAAQKALKVPERTKADTLFLMSLLDALEQVSRAELVLPPCRRDHLRHVTEADRCR